MQLKNSSDMAVSSKQKDGENREVILEIMLPKGFQNLKSTSYFKDAALVITEQGFYDTMAVPPGEYAVNFSYTLDITSSILLQVPWILSKGFHCRHPTLSFLRNWDRQNLKD
jgi:hypothetical protein